MKKVSTNPRLTKNAERVTINEAMGSDAQLGNESPCAEEVGKVSDGLEKLPLCDEIEEGRLLAGQVRDPRM